MTPEGQLADAAERAPARADSIRVLLVEDSPEYALLVRHQLAGELGEGARIEHRGSIEEAKPLLKEDDVDCVLLDLSLPDATNLEALKAVRAQAPRTPIVVLSGDENEEVAVRAVHEGAQDYLVKRHSDAHLLARSIRYSMERKRAELELAHRATHDSLTGLPNRTLFLDRLEMTLARIERRERACAVLFVDLDRFKVVNDTLGHDVGDRLLAAAADRLRELVRPSDTVARFGGDEFLVLCDDLAGPADAEVVASRMVEAIGRPFEIDGHELSVGASIGITIAADRSRAAHELVREADQTMYRAKESGGSWRIAERAGGSPATPRAPRGLELQVTMDPALADADPDELAERVGAALRAAGLPPVRVASRRRG